MTPGKKQAFEPTGLIPRSIVRTFERFYKQLLPRTKYSAIREYRISRYQVLVSIRCLCTLLILPLATRIIANWLIFPQIQYFWNVTYQDEHVFSEIDQFSQVIFFDSLLDPGLLEHNQVPSSPISYSEADTKPISVYSINNSQIESAMCLDRKFTVTKYLLPNSKQKISFTSHIGAPNLNQSPIATLYPPYFILLPPKLVYEPYTPNVPYKSMRYLAKQVEISKISFACFAEQSCGYASNPYLQSMVTNLVYPYGISHRFVTQREGQVQQPVKINSLITNFDSHLTNTQAPYMPSYYAKPLLAKERQAEQHNKVIQNQALQEKIFELAQSSHSHALQSLTNVFADFLSIMVLVCLLITLKPEITILKSFLVEVIYNLSDTTKSFLLILMTDLLVGFHSPRGWETMFSLILHHFGLPENQDFVFLFVATLPVILDTVFKYWIFRHLNKISPSTVATYHNMIE